MASHPEVAPDRTPLCVDLDGTLVRTDTLHETFVSFLKTAPWRIWELPFWLLRGRANVKRRLAQCSFVNFSLLPYSQPVLEAIAKAREEGRPVILVTAADKAIANKVAKHLGVFDEVLASDGERNLKGATKTKALVERFGEGGYDYIGNSRADVDVWRHARKALVVQASGAVETKAKVVAKEATVLERGRSRLRPLVKELRPHQWVKNVLVFVPLLVGHAYYDQMTVLKALVIFVAWCAMASCIYAMNDLLDLEADRRHPRKSRRPFASGALSIGLGLIAAPMLGLLSLGLAAWLNLASFCIVLLYGISSLAYSVYLKKHAIVDAFTLAGLYTLRVVGGWTATDQQPSVWLFAFSGFLFLGLAFLKRSAELFGADEKDLAHARRGYRVADLPVIVTFGIVSGFLSSLVMALYVHTSVARELYHSPPILWAMVPPILLWQCRLWLATGRKQMEDDPIVYSAKDWVSWVLGGLMVLAFLVALKSDIWRDDPTQLPTQKKQILELEAKVRRLESEAAARPGA